MIKFLFGIAVGAAAMFVGMSGVFDQRVPDVITDPCKPSGFDPSRNARCLRA